MTLSQQIINTRRAMSKECVVCGKQHLNQMQALLSRFPLFERCQEVAAFIAACVTGITPEVPRGKGLVRSTGSCDKSQLAAVCLD